MTNFNVKTVVVGDTIRFRTWDRYGRYTATRKVKKISNTEGSGSVVVRFNSCDWHLPFIEVKEIIEQVDLEPHILRAKYSARGGGIEISLDKLGWPGVKMTAYQNYLGGGMLGSIANDCTISDWKDDWRLVAIAERLARYFHEYTNPDPEGYPWESTSFEELQKRPLSAY